MDEKPQAEGGVFSPVSRMMEALCDTAGNRVELFLLEVKEERLGLFDALLLAAVVIVCAAMTFLLVTLAVVAVFWDTHPVLALLLAAAIYAVGAVAGFVKLHSRLQRWEAFSTTLEEFKKDRACFKKPN
jgi:uncharacterized membrane protein YqjE